MKGQQIFHTFLPGVTAAVLTTQPAWAENLKASGIQLNTTATNNTIITTKVNRQQPQGSNSPNTVITPGKVAISKFQPLSTSAMGIMVTGKTGVPIKAAPGKQPKTVLTLTPALSNFLGKNRPHSAPEQGNSVITTRKQKMDGETLAPNTEGAKIFPQQELQPAASNQSSGKLLDAVWKRRNCPPLSGDKKTVEVSNPNCQKPMAQIPPEADQPPFPEVEQPEVNDSAQPPDYLNPSPNPLQFPTEAEEVEVQGTQPITLEQALELAKRNNKDLQLALLQQQRAESAVREAQAALYPDVNLTTQVSRQQSASSQLQNELSGFSTGPDPVTDSVNAQAQLRYDLYTSGRRSANIRAAEGQLRSAELDVENIAEEIRQNVSLAYYNLQDSDEQVRINESAVRNAEASLKDAQALERAGVGTRFDVLRSQVNLANAQQDLTTALSNQQISRRQLANLLSLSQRVDISAADPVKLAGLWNENLEGSIVKAFQNRPDLQQRLTQRNINEQRRREALATLGPQVSLIANYDLLDQFDDGVGVTDGYTVALRASLNVFDGGAAKARAAQAKANIAIAETQFSQQRNQVRLEVEQQYYTLQSSLENVQTANAALDQAKEALRLARLRFQAGVGTQTDVIAAENDLTRAEGNRIRAILDYNRALTRLQRAVTSRSSQ